MVLEYYSNLKLITKVMVAIKVKSFRNIHTTDLMFNMTKEKENNAFVSSIVQVK